MPKIPWTPPKRPPRIKVQPEPEPDPVTNPCGRCNGEGELYSYSRASVVPCWVCKGSGLGLPPPPAGDLHSDGSQRPTFDGQRRGRTDLEIQAASRIQRSAGTHDPLRDEALRRFAEGMALGRYVLSENWPEQ